MRGGQKGVAPSRARQGRTTGGRDVRRKKERVRGRNEGKKRPDERWDNPMSGQRRRSETADEGDETAHEGKGVATKPGREARGRERDERSSGRGRQGERERRGRETAVYTVEGGKKR